MDSRVTPPKTGKQIKSPIFLKDGAYILYICIIDGNESLL